MRKAKHELFPCPRNLFLIFRVIIDLRIVIILAQQYLIDHIIENRIPRPFVILDACIDQVIFVSVGKLLIGDLSIADGGDNLGFVCRAVWKGKSGGGEKDRKERPL